MLPKARSSPRRSTGRFVALFNFKTKLKGLGHAILGNFRTDQMVIELTKI